MLRPGTAILAACLALGLAGCDALTGTAKIGDVVREPAAFEGKEVRLHGTATPMLKIPLAETKGYRLKDATGEIVVWTTGPMPGEGESVRVRGKVENLMIVAGQSYGLSVREAERTSP